MANKTRRRTPSCFRWFTIGTLGRCRDLSTLRLLSEMKCKMSEGAISLCSIERSHFTKTNHLTEQVALITAAGSDMGAAIARKLAELDYKVAILSSSGKG